ncbi:RNA binding protein [Dunaliella salina]|uniref:RNA binding protein n=1 Tax=Dunaliella salina TaxID=3046 RepID=A0ABQ7GC64_DUNSA|nr:RNA binding protein [Dunaliella salina]|eukprot:KAF5832193.1 RNA binding protein [Dunaliella salina]
MPPIMEAQRHNSILDGLDLTPMDASSEAHRKLAVLGLPWETTEDTLRLYFEQFGALEGAEVMKDRYTGKSRGFGFVTFADLSSAQNALAAEHTIEGRRCEAKVALPKGEPSAPRTTRIFVARIPPSVSEAQFKGYFEGFGKLQDAYMPRDHAKQGYRGIGFVTFTSADSVEKVMAVKHWMNGHEIAIDRATPKEEPSVLKSMFARLPLTTGQRRSFDNGAGIIGPGLTSIMTSSGVLGMSNLRPKGPTGLEHPAYQQLRSLSEDRQGPSIEGPALDLTKAQHAFPNGAGSVGLAAERCKVAQGLGMGSHETSEADVREYFMRFGYVMDVYMPKAKDNKTEHRGFGFVTFETEAAIQRVVSHGAHRLKGSTIAIDIAVPKVEEEALGETDGGVGISPHFLNPAISSFLAQRI